MFVRRDGLEAGDRPSARSTATGTVGLFDARAVRRTPFSASFGAGRYSIQPK